MSSKRTEPLNLERDLPTSSEDVEALRQARHSSIRFQDYLAQLSRRDARPPKAPRRTFEGCAPFEL